MIQNFDLVENIGKFDSCDDGRRVPLKPITLIYAENGRGKTTLSAILRSLSTGASAPILERTRLGANGSPKVEIRVRKGHRYVFNNSTWNSPPLRIFVYDDEFVDRNVYSGLAVSPQHRQNLHGIVLGEQGVTLATRYDQYIEKVNVLNQNLQTIARSIPESQRHGLDVETFCRLPAEPNIDDSIRTLEQRLAAVEQQDQINNKSFLAKFEIPTFDFDDYSDKLATDSPTLDQEAIDNVVAHFSSVHPDAEGWVNQGLGFVATENTVTNCPFCAQSLQTSSIIAHYRQFFNQAYQNLLAQVSRLTAEIDRIFAEQHLRNIVNVNNSNKDLCRFWSNFSDNVDVETDHRVEELEANWDDTKNALKRLATFKRSRPLDPVSIDDVAQDIFTNFTAISLRFNTVNEALDRINLEINRIKSSVADIDKSAVSNDLSLKRAIKRRYEPGLVSHCDGYLQELRDKSTTEQARDNAKNDLDIYRANAFPQYETGINDYLDRFNTDFRVTGLHSRFTSSFPVGNYDVTIDNQIVKVAGSSSANQIHSFGNTLSAGDRNSLALAVFFESLDRSQNLQDSIIVIDDPVSSLDNYRAETTIEVINDLRPDKCSQLILLSHSMPFLLEVWKGLGQPPGNQCATVAVVRRQASSTIEKWDITDALITEYDRRHRAFLDYLQNGSTELFQIAYHMRPHLESYLRVAHPSCFEAGTMIGEFLNKVKPLIATNDEVLDQVRYNSLDYLRKYGNKFHHDTNPNAQRENPTDTELSGYVKRTLRFVGQRV